MADKRKALRTSPFDDAEIEASIFGGPQVQKEAKQRVVKPVRQKASKIAKQQAGKTASQQSSREPTEKVMMRLPRPLAVEFQQVYLRLAAAQLDASGKKLYVQDCHVEAISDWVKKQSKRLEKDS